MKKGPKMNHYLIGELVHLLLSFVDTVTQAGIDPNLVTLHVSGPDGTFTKTYGVDADLIRDGAGKYHLDYSPANAGVFNYYSQGTGYGQSKSQTETFVVDG
jgi:hypothetical protein